ncbi:Crotonobetainyl-CoA:carnitine CoA-transferase CaiB [Mameliella alba]|uniref:CaiB/BaiF CoA transferase family protein n=1 Tax=Mameliella alba TaxID=561184 RepID=UPI00088AE8C7|nr:CaiB/BaiF CoA-transferase family protein [Mameliella alba]OWV45302.1 CoA transferase [Mameliella alba]PTR36772.1 crotonobetainyl-CoA:carnitine CoA-transferase CaiB-like acyl-CoA transferase [Mameliella alba]GGF77717.1 CoA transferase [Mameliella alba]SDD88401.1 Crotonobetainyl-CoA:carnitine CoA-transferase CaiB [Mameliella alba]
MPGALNHLKVLDFSRIFAGPWTAQMLADFGADVVKVEHVKGGDDVRRMGVPHLGADGEPTGETSSFLAMNRGKRSLALDLSKPEGQDIALRLVAEADVLIENFKTGTLARFGLDYQEVAKLNPRLVYCSITGFGQTGPMKHLPGYDPIFQAMSGLLSMTGIPDGQPGAGPALVGYSISDITAGQYAVSAILAALNHRDAVSGEGQFIDIALLDTQIHAASHMAMNYLSSGRLPRRNGTASQITCPWQAFDCADRPIMIAIGNDAQFSRFADYLGLPELAQDDRYATNLARVQNADTLIPQIAAKLATKQADACYAELEAIGIPAGPLNSFDDVFRMEQVQERGLLQEMQHGSAGLVRYVSNPVKFSGLDAGTDMPPPRFAEHTDAVLTGLGLDADQIAGLRAAGIVK